MNVSLKPAVAAMLVLATMSAGCADDPTAPENVLPVATIDGPGQDTTVTAGDAVDFLGTASDSDGTVASHAWSFGDGSSALVEDPGSHTYATAGTFTATYEVTDNGGATSVPASVTLTVVEPTPPLQGATWLVTSGGLTAEGVTNFLVTFDANSLDIVRIEYTFNGTSFDYDDTVVTGAASIGSSVSIFAEWSNSTFEFTGVFTSSQTEAVGIVAFAITEGPNFAGDITNGKITKQ